MITEHLLQAMPRKGVLILQLNKTLNNNILKALQVVPDKESNPSTSNSSKKIEHGDLGILTQDQIQLKVLKILENIEMKLFDQPNPNQGNPRWEKTHIKCINKDKRKGEIFLSTVTHMVLVNIEGININGQVQTTRVMQLSSMK